MKKCKYALEQAVQCGKLKPGDWIWTIQYGWVKVTKINMSGDLPTLRVRTDLCSLVTYYSNGKFYFNDKFPSAFLEPLPQLDQTPKPIDLEPGDKVMVRMGNEASWLRRHFSHFEDGAIWCYKDGGTSWSSDGQTTAWLQWRLPTEDEL